jgi:hypothetical protein
MSEVSFVIADRQVATFRLEPNNIQGRDLAGQPALYLPLQMQLLPGGQQKNVQYTLVRLAGKLQSQHLAEFASFDVGPIAEVANPEPFFRHQEALVVLDRHQVRRFEDARSGNDAYLLIVLSGLVWYPAQQKFEMLRSFGQLEAKIPKSHWAENVLTAWNLSGVKVVEIEFPRGVAGEAFRTSYARVEEAEKHYASGRYKEALTSLRLSFEGLANGLGYDGRVKDCIEHLFADAHAEKKQKGVEALVALYKFLHLGPHEQAGGPDTGSDAIVLRRDARFALTMALAVFEYVTPQH